MDNPSQFYLAVQGILKSWTALQLAVSHGFGGSHSAEKAQWLVGVMENFFLSNDDLEEYEVENFLAQIMSDEFETVLEDDSLSLIAKELCTVYSLWSLNKTSELNAKLQALPQVNLSECVSQCEEEVSSMPALPEQEHEMSTLSLSNSSANDISNQDNNENASIDDDDGWTTVKTRSRTKKRS